MNRIALCVFVATCCFIGAQAEWSGQFVRGISQNGINYNVSIGNNNGHYKPLVHGVGPEYQIVELWSKSSFVTHMKRIVNGIMRASFLLDHGPAEHTFITETFLFKIFAGENNTHSRSVVVDGQCHAVMELLQLPEWKAIPEKIRDHMWYYAPIRACMIRQEVLTNKGGLICPFGGSRKGTVIMAEYSTLTSSTQFLCLTERTYNRVEPIAKRKSFDGFVSELAQLGFTPRVDYNTITLSTAEKEIEG